jgi:hypothetical protein
MIQRAAERSIRPSHGGIHEANDALKEQRMFRKSILASIFAACLMLTPMLVRGAGNDGTGSITVSATVDTFAEWDPTNTYTVTFATINSRSTASASRNLTLYANINCGITATAVTNSGVLTNGSYTLTTTYRISGDASGDGNMLGTAAFFNAGNSYAVTHTPGDGQYTVTLEVDAAPPGTGAPEAGTYECELSLTATWS